MLAPSCQARPPVPTHPDTHTVLVHHKHHSRTRQNSRGQRHEGHLYRLESAQNLVWVGETKTSVILDVLPLTVSEVRSKHWNGFVVNVIANGNRSGPGTSSGRGPLAFQINLARERQVKATAGVRAEPYFLGRALAGRPRIRRGVSTTWVAPKDPALMLGCAEQWTSCRC